MDPLSVTASFLALRSISLQLSQTLYQITSEVRDVPAYIKNLSIILQDLQDVFTGFTDLPRFPTYIEIGKFVQLLSRYAADLKILQELLPESTMTPAALILYHRNPRSLSEQRELIDVLPRLTSYKLDFRLLLEGISTISRTSSQGIYKTSIIVRFLSTLSSKQPN